MIPWLALGSALWLGVLTSISPCPLASNIAAIGFITRKASRLRQVLLSGLAYTLGRTLAYVALAAAILAGVLASDEAARFLQRYLMQLLGPILIVAGLVLLGWMGTGLSWNLAGQGVQQRIARARAPAGLGWAFVLGVLLAMSFCPVSAVLYFGGLLPLSARAESRLLVPAVFGAGTAMPVIAFALLMALAGQQVAKAFDRLAALERWLRIATGVIFIGVGIYYSLTAIWGMRFEIEPLNH